MKFRRFYLWVALPIVIIVAWTALFYWPMSKEMRSRRQEIAATTKSIEGVDREQKEAGAVIERERQIKQSLSDVYGRIPRLSELPDVMRWMVQGAKKQGLALEVVQSRVSSLQTSGVSSVVHPVVEVRVRGRFLEIGRFLDDLEGRPLFKGVTSGKITAQERDNPLVLATCTLEMNTWKERTPEGK